MIYDNNCATNYELQCVASSINVYYLIGLFNGLQICVVELWPGKPMQRAK